MAAQDLFKRNRCGSRIRVLCASILCSAGTASAATKVYQYADNAPGICEHFRRALEVDKVTSMSPLQLCQYNFEQRHADKGYFQKLAWQRVPGDPVAMTMKIFDDNEPPLDLLPAGGDKKYRADVLAYAKLQAQHGALSVEMAPIVLTALIMPATYKRINAYVLRSVGNYCSVGLNIKRNEMLAFYSDKILTKSFPIVRDFYGDVLQPVQINGKYYLVDDGYGPAWAKARIQRGGAINSFGINSMQLSTDQKQIFQFSVCGFTYLKKAR